MLSDILEDSWAFQELKERAEKLGRQEAERKATEKAEREAAQKVAQEVAQEVEQAKREVAQQAKRKVEQLKRELVQQLAQEMEREVARARQEMTRKALQEGLQQGLQQGRLAQERETLGQYVELHFPALLPLLQEQTKGIQNADVLQQLLFNLFAARSEDQARSMILTAHS